MKQLLRDVDTLLSTQSSFLLGKWIEDARSLGTDEVSKNYYEENARTIVSTWGYPIIGVGGLMTPDDVRAMLDAGAALVQIYTGYIYNGPGYVREICRALLEKKAAEN